MRFPLPPSHRLSRDELLRHVRDDLRRRYPSFATVLDTPGDPGWMLLEQAAWVAEILSSSLDDHPRAVVSFLLALLGRELRPATPSVGVVSLQASAAVSLEPGAQAGVLPPRLYSPLTEGREQVEFALVERRIPLAPGRLTGIYRVLGGRMLGRQLTHDAFPKSHVAWSGGERDMALLDREQLVYRLERKLDDVLRGVLDKLVQAFQPGNPAAVGWLRLSYRDRAGSAEVIANLDPAAAFPAEGAERRPSDWGRIHDWRPELQPTEAGRGLRIDTGADGEPVLRGCPDEGAPEELVRSTEVAPADFPQQFWRRLRTLAGTAGARLPLSPIVSRRAVAPADTPNWLAQLPFQPFWAHVTDGSPMLSLDVAPLDEGQSVRLGLVVEDFERSSAPVALRVLASDGSLMGLRPVWTIPVPRPAAAGKGSATLAVFELDRAHQREGGSLLLLAPPAPTRFLGLFLNPALIINAPLVVDGRSVDVGLSPDEVDLLFDDLLSREVLDTVGERLPGDAARPLRRLLAQLPLAHIDVQRGGEQLEVLQDWAAFRLDASAGRAQFGVPGPDGRRRLLPGSTLQLDWYRRTSGTLGNLAAGEIVDIEVDGDLGDVVLAVTNPVATHLGQAQETPAGAVYRMFGPERGAIPTVPSDLERTVREALGPEEGEWIVKVWTHAERMLLATSWWGAEHGPSWVVEAVAAARQRLDELGTGGLLVTLGDPEGGMDAAHFHSVAGAVRDRIRSVADRVPYIKDAAVVPFHPLRFEAGEDVDEELLPCFHPTRLPVGLVGDLDSETLTDRLRAGVDLWLDAAVLEARRKRRIELDEEILPDAAGFAEMQIRDW